VPQVLYWAAKSYEAAGDAALAAETMRRLEQGYPWSFHGLLASEGKPADVGPAANASQAIKEPEPEPAYEDPKLSRAYELVLQGMLTEATAELKKAETAYCGSLEGLTAISALYVLAGDYRRPLELASGMYQSGMNTGGAIVPMDALRIMFPLGYWDTVKEQADTFGIDPFLITGIIREESHYNPGAVSPAGAVGLMQLMPGTAKAVCKKLDISYSTPQQLLRGDFNVPVGVCYLDSLYEKHGGRLVRVLAEYNAGPRPLTRWTQKMPDAKDDLFIEGIDYKETRSYVTRVLRNYFIYRRLYGQ
jgi:soluble lytic murein transglycosylase